MKHLPRVIYLLRTGMTDRRLNVFLGVESATRSVGVFLSAETIPPVVGAITTRLNELAVKAFSTEDGEVADKEAVIEINHLLTFVHSLFGHLGRDQGSFNGANEKLVRLALEEDLAPVMERLSQDR